MDRGTEEVAKGYKCPNCGSENIVFCQPCGRKKLKCKDCLYLAIIKRFIKVQ